MGAGCHLLSDSRRSIGMQSGQEDRALHLCARDRRRVVDGLESSTTNDKRREATAVASVDRRSHAPQWLDDPVHRPGSDRLVASQHREPREGRRHAGHETDAGSGVPDVDHAVGFVKSVSPAVDPVAIDSRPHGANRGGGVLDVLAGGQPPDAALPVSQSRQDQRPVRDRLVAGDAQDPPQRTTCLADGEDAHSLIP